MKKIKLKVTEHEIQATIIRWLERHKWFVWRNNSGMMFLQNRAIKMGKPGLPDVFAVKDGILAAIEVKKPGNKPTEIQKAMLDELEDHGVWTLVAYSVDDVEKKFKVV